MSLVAGDLIDEARDFDAAFNKDAVGDRLLLRSLSRAEQRLYREITELSEDALETETSYDNAALLTAIADDGEIEVPSHLRLGAARAISEGVVYPVEIFASEGDALARHYAEPANDYGIRRVGRQFFLAHHPRRFTSDSATYVALDLWKDVEALFVRYVPLPPALTSMTASLLAPDAARGALVAAIAAFAAKKTRSAAAATLGQDAEMEVRSLTNLLVADSLTPWTVRRVV